MQQGASLGEQDYSPARIWGDTLAPVASLAGKALVPSRFYGLWEFECEGRRETGW